MGIYEVADRAVHETTLSTSGSALLRRGQGRPPSSASASSS